MIDILKLIEKFGIKNWSQCLVMFTVVHDSINMIWYAFSVYMKTCLKIVTVDCFVNVHLGFLGPRFVSMTNPFPSSIRNRYLWADHTGMKQSTSMV